MSPTVTIHCGDSLEALRGLPPESVHCCVTSPPYWGLRDYGHAGQIGLEQTLQEFVARLVAVFDEVRRVLRADGTCWVNMGDSYAGSWGAQSRSNPGSQASSTLGGGSTLSARQIQAHPKETQTGSLKNTPACKSKDLIGVPWMLAFALRDSGWYLRQDIIWAKPNPMPESVRDRCTKAHEYLFLLTKSERYFWDSEAMQEPSGGWNWSRFDDGKNAEVHPNVGRKRESVKRGGFNGKTSAFEGREAFRAVTDTRNKRSVWSVPTQPFKEAHFATFPPDLIRPCVRAGCPAGGTVLDPFGGSGTTGMVALEEGRSAILIELNPKYAEMAERRCHVTPTFAALA